LHAVSTTKFSLGRKINEVLGELLKLLDGEPQDFFLIIMITKTWDFFSHLPDGFILS